MEWVGDKPWSRVSEIRVCGWTVGPAGAPGLGRSACAFVRLELGGGYLRAAVVAESLLARFVALDAAFPILACAPMASMVDESCKVVSGSG